MTRKLRTTFLALGATAVATGGMATMAQAGNGDSIEGTVSSPGIQMVVKAADGNLHNSRIFGSVKMGNQEPMRAEGPVTCLDVDGNKVGLFYPMEQSTPSLMSRAGLGVYMNMTLKGNQVKSISYSVVPKKRGGCKPAPTFIPASGSMKVSGG